MTNVAVDHVSKVFPGDVRAVDEVTLDVEDREFLALLGPSGCGKTTLLRLIAGLETPTSGEIRIGDRVVNDTPPKDRDVAMVFQNYALYPHWSVADNITLGLRTRRLPKPAIAQRLADGAAVLNLSALLRRLPRQLSGGQQQRVALGRAMVREPKVFLLDEPLSNLDARLRLHMRTELIKLHRRMETTTVYVTHDQGEAMAMATRVAVMRDGAIEQVGPPMEVYRNPINRYVAGFMGNPEMNFIDGTVTQGRGRVRAKRSWIRPADARRTGRRACRPGRARGGPRDQARRAHRAAGRDHRWPRSMRVVDIVEPTRKSVACVRPGRRMPASWPTSMRVKSRSPGRRSGSGSIRLGFTRSTRPLASRSGEPVPAARSRRRETRMPRSGVSDASHEDRCPLLEPVHELARPVGCRPAS